MADEEKNEIEETTEAAEPEAATNTRARAVRNMVAVPSMLCAIR